MSNTDTTINAEEKKKRKPVCGILSIVLGGVSIIPFLGIVSIPALILGVVGIFREKHITAIIGTVLSGVSLILSPTVWVMIGCSFSDCDQKKTEPVTQGMNPPVLEAPLQAGSAPSPTIPQTSYSASVAYPQEWEGKKFKEHPEDKGKTIHTYSEQDFKKYRQVSNAQAIMMHEVLDKKADESLDVFITRYAEEKFRVAHPKLTITPMAPATLSSGQVAQLRLFGNTSLGNEEVVAYIDGGTHVFMLVVAAPSRDELMKAWSAFSDVLLKRVNFSVKK